MTKLCFLTVSCVNLNSGISIYDDTNGHVFRLSRMEVIRVHTGVEFTKNINSLARLDRRQETRIRCSLAVECASARRPVFMPCRARPIPRHSHIFGIAEERFAVRG
ncbi:hypothetical protein OG21DRAFT_1504507 [Imleria badia]|nr:hypothetical protein OG21DRAFT_1504507 [Imleria badia]